MHSRQDVLRCEGVPLPVGRVECAAPAVAGASDKGGQTGAIK